MKKEIGILNFSIKGKILIVITILMVLFSVVAIFLPSVRVTDPDIEIKYSDITPSSFDYKILRPRVCFAVIAIVYICIKSLFFSEKDAVVSAFLASCIATYFILEQYYQVKENKRSWALYMINNNV